MKRCRTFTAVRTEDVSGVSGTGVIAEGVLWHDGKVTISWFGRHHITEDSPDLKTWLDIHGHGGKTTIKWDSEQPVSESPKPGFTEAIKEWRGMFRNGAKE